MGSKAYILKVEPYNFHAPWNEIGERKMILRKIPHVSTPVFFLFIKSDITQSLHRNTQQSTYIKLIKSKSFSCYIDLADATNPG